MRVWGVVFARRPTPGRAKTRLAPALGDDGAARLAEAMAGDALDAVVAAFGAGARLAVDAPWVPEGHGGVPQLTQGDGDLGARLERVFQAGLAEADAVIAVGADTAGLDARRLRAVADALCDADVAIAPAEDGGYWALGARVSPPGWLRAVRWGGPYTRADTLLAAALAGLRPALGPSGWDVDEPGDLVRLDALLRDDRVHAPRTRAARR